MDIQPVGTGPASLNLPVSPAAGPAAGAASILNAAAKPGADSVAGLLEQLSSPMIESLLSQLGSARSALDPQVFQSLLQTAVSSVLSGDIPGALHAVARLVNLDPERGVPLVNQALAGDSPLTAIHAEVQSLVQRLAANAKADAHQTLAAAARAIDAAGPHALRAGEADPRVVLTIAERLADAGPHINYVRADELGKFVVAYFDFGGPRPMYGSAAAKRSGAITAAAPARLPRWLTQLAGMWRRAPLLLLLLVWFLLGLTCGVVTIAARAVGLAAADSPTVTLAFELWGLGFLVIVALGFVRSLRGLRR